MDDENGIFIIAGQVDGDAAGMDTLKVFDDGGASGRVRAVLDR